MGIRRKQEILTGEIATRASGLIKAYLTKHAIPTHAWIVLTNRISLVIQPTAAKNIFTIAEELQKLIKQKALPKEVDFYGDFLDHLLRKSEDPRFVSTELLAQCVSLGLAPNPKEYPFCGSFLHDMNQLATPESLMIESNYATSQQAK